MAIRIKVSRNELVSNAQKITTEISTIEREWRNIESIIKRTKGYWEGDASDVHQQHYSSFINEVQTMIKNLKDRPDELLKMAGFYEEAEQANVEAANSLSSDVFK